MSTNTRDVDEDTVVHNVEELLEFLNTRFRTQAERRQTPVGFGRGVKVRVWLEHFEDGSSAKDVSVDRAVDA